MVDGVPILTLAKEFGVNESALRRRLKPTLAERATGITSMRAVAVKKARALADLDQANREVAAMPPTKQIIVDDLVQQMRVVASHMAGAAEYSASTSRHLAAIANGMAVTIKPSQKLTDADVAKLKQVNALTDLSNAASILPARLLVASRDAAPPPAGRDEISDLSDEDLSAELGRYGIEPA